MPETIQVPMEIDRVQRYGNEGVSVWGYVGDYHVCIHMSIAEARTKGLLPNTEGRATNASRR